MATTGMRRGECLGLKWSDVDKKTSTVKIDRNATYTSKSGTIVGTPSGMPLAITSIRDQDMKRVIPVELTR